MKNNIITAGVDEVGRGCLAGPVVSAAVILNDEIDLKEIKDSKKINFGNRIKISEYIKKNSYYAIGLASVEEIFNINILQAALLSMKRAIDKLSKKPELILVDGPFAPKGLKNYKTIIKGDEKYLSIAAASILAKTERDNYMLKIHEEYPQYGWNTNKGYPTKFHKQAILKFGITKYHRKSFKLFDEQLNLKL